MCFLILLHHLHTTPQNKLSARNPLYPLCFHNLCNVVYKLRCAMLHESNPTVVGTEENITHFSLIWRPASSCSRVPIERCIKLDENGAPQQQAISIDIVSLCQDICEAALLYYRKNKEHFSFNYRIISASNRLANLFGYDNEINI